MAAQAKAVGLGKTVASPTEEHPLFGAVLAQIEQRLLALCGPAGGEGVAAAQSYALLAPGKRVRPMLTVLAARQHGAESATALDPACALEMVHTASLILDDLPCMDDALLRRGRAATHRVFGEAASLLAAVGLLNRGFGVLALTEAPVAARIAMVERLSAAVGPDGLVGGQEADLGERASYLDCADVDALNQRKTGALFVAAMEMGALAAGADVAAVRRMARAGAHVGLAFQTIDDLLDCTRRTEELGKDANKDQGKPSVVSLAGMEAARARVQHDLERAVAAARDAGGDSGDLEAYLGLLFAQAAL